MHSMNDDFTAKKWTDRFTFEFNVWKPFEEHTHFRYIHIDEFDRRRERWIRMDKVHPDDPFRLEAKRDYEACQREFVSIN